MLPWPICSNCREPPSLMVTLARTLVCRDAGLRAGTGRARCACLLDYLTVGLLVGRAKPGLLLVTPVCSCACPRIARAHTARPTAQEAHQQVDVGRGALPNQLHHAIDDI